MKQLLSRCYHVCLASETIIALGEKDSILILNININVLCINFDGINNGNGNNIYISHRVQVIRLNL